MTAIAHEQIKKYIDKMGIEKDAGEWMKEHNLEIRTANGEEPIASEYKFDRLIANLVLMLTENPVKMLKNLNEMAEEGALLGVTIWGDKTKSNLLTILREALEANGMPVPKTRGNFHLYQRLGDLAA